MKRNKLNALLVAIMALVWSNLAMAQYDDLYYDPDTDSGYYYDDDSYSMMIIHITKKTIMDTMTMSMIIMTMMITIITTLPGFAGFTVPIMGSATTIRYM